MASSEPIIVREDNGMWHVDYQDGNTQNFPAKGEPSRRRRRSLTAKVARFPSSSTVHNGH